MGLGNRDPVLSIWSIYILVTFILIFSSWTVEIFASWQAGARRGWLPVVHLWSSPPSTVGPWHVRTQALGPSLGFRRSWLALPAPSASASNSFHLTACHLGRKGAAGSWGGPVFQVLSPTGRALCLLIGVKWEHQILISSLMESGDLGEFSSPALGCALKPSWTR